MASGYVHEGQNKYVDRGLLFLNVFAGNGIIIGKFSNLFLIRLRLTIIFNNLKIIFNTCALFRHMCDSLFRMEAYFCPVAYGLEAYIFVSILGGETPAYV